jgi:2-amino-4-hydroxy-6-hydroxymethyldihydropteridine diphosphokinase
MAIVFLSLGSNKGKRRYYIEEMVRKLVPLMENGIRRSSMMETEPVGMPPGQRWFCNLIVRAGYTGSVEQLLAQCNRIEEELGRLRQKPRAARTADIDILLYGHIVIRKKTLKVPHPQILNRRFCLEGLVQLGPHWKLPDTELTMSEHYHHMAWKVRHQEVVFLNGRTIAAGRKNHDEFK